MNNKSFYIPKDLINKHWLEKNGFCWSRIHSDNSCDVYLKRFIVWKYGSAGLIEGELMLNCSDGKLTIGCYDYGTRYPYAGFYCREYGLNNVVEEIDKKIMKELNKIGAEEYD